MGNHTSVVVVDRSIPALSRTIGKIISEASRPAQIFLDGVGSWLSFICIVQYFHGLGPRFRVPYRELRSVFCSWCDIEQQNAPAFFTLLFCCPLLCLLFTSEHFYRWDSQQMQLQHTSQGRYGRWERPLQHYIQGILTVFCGTLWIGVIASKERGWSLANSVIYTAWAWKSGQSRYRLQS